MNIGLTSRPGAEWMTEPNFEPADDGRHDDAEPEDDTPASWAPIDLTAYLDGTHTAPEPELMPRSDGWCLLYRGLVHSIHGESESGKSLVAQVEVVRAIASGMSVLYVDMESDPGSVVTRLITFGADPARIAAQFRYVQPDAQPTNSSREAAAFQGLLREQWDLVVIDGVTGALSLWGTESNDNDGVTAWSRSLPERFARAGAAVVLIDHVTKSTEGRGRFAIGAQAKLSTITGAAYTLDVKQPLGIGRIGILSLRIGKDRPGSIRGKCGEPRPSDRTQEAAVITIDSTGDKPVVTIAPPEIYTAEHPFRPTVLMAKVSRALEGSPEPLSARAIEDLVSGKRDKVALATKSLVAEGFVTVAPGPRGATLHTSVRPFRDGETPPPPTSPHLPPGEVNDLPPSPALRDGGGQQPKTALHLPPTDCPTCGQANTPDRHAAGLDCMTCYSALITEPEDQP